MKNKELVFKGSSLRGQRTNVIEYPNHRAPKPERICNALSRFVTDHGYYDIDMSEERRRQIKDRLFKKSSHRKKPYPYFAPNYEAYMSERRFMTSSALTGILKQIGFTY